MDSMIITKKYKISNNCNISTSIIATAATDTMYIEYMMQCHFYIILLFTSYLIIYVYYYSYVAPDTNYSTDSNYNALYRSLTD
ncbi:hypothetical protein H8356DRAFT_1341339 [Neocallimastix lanati (nom. inval.)]|nr:hypothetical protein H8356DRAFT_1341339 [Neocallimastix sp. JGI-2020a]